MIWGRTVEQERANRDQWKAAFAWLPVRLSSGQWLWWEHYAWRCCKSSPSPGVPGVYLCDVMQRLPLVGDIETFNEDWKEQCRMKRAEMTTPPKR